MAESISTGYPTIPESNWWAIRNQFARTLPSTVNFGYLKSLLQLNSEQAARNLISPLQKLGIIDADGKPTDRANEWRHDATYPSVCQKMIEDVYPEQLRELYSGKAIDRKAVEAWFQYTAKLGASAARKAAALYLLLNEATPKSGSEVIKSKALGNKTTITAPTNRKTTKPSNPKVFTPLEPPPQLPVAPTSTPNSVPDISTEANVDKGWFSLHVDLQIHISPDASAEQIDQIFASMAKHIVAMKTSN